MAPSKVASNIRGSAAYKKKQGSLGISSDQKSIIWTPIDSGSSVGIAVANITSTSIYMRSEYIIYMLISSRFAANSGDRCEGDVENLRKVT